MKTHPKIHSKKGLYKLFFHGCKPDKAVCEVDKDFSKDGCNRCVEAGVECSHKSKIRGKRYKKASRARKRAR